MSVHSMMLSMALATALAGMAPQDSAASAHASAVHGCSARSQQGMPAIGRILSVRNLRCAAAERYYLRHRGDDHVPMTMGQVTYIGVYACRVYQDLTPPGPSDIWVRFRCVHGGRAFRVEYGV